MQLVPKLSAYSSHTLSCPAGKEVFPGANKSLFVQFKKISEASQAITDLIVLSSANKAKVPSGYRRLP